MKVPAENVVLQRALGALQQRRPAEAERLAGEVLARQPAHVGALHLVGLARLAQGRAQEALAPLRSAAAAGADAAIETHLAIALRQTGSAAEAVTLLERAVARQPPFLPAFHELGVLLFAQRRLDEAEAVLKRGLALAPAMAELAVVLGGIHLDRADRAKAKLVFARALANAPGHPGALFGLGNALMDEREFAPAAERFRQALACDPGYVQARLALATCLLELDRWDEAIESFRAAVKTAPHFYARALRALVTAGRGRFWLRPSVAAAMLKP
jgi:tetratricopeptide (TPR) repeat protein